MTLSRIALAVFFIVAGVMHFVSPLAYTAIVPPWLPSPLALVYISGVAEIAGGLGVLSTRTRRIAALGLIALLVAVFPANIYGALHGMEFRGQPVPQWLLWARLPLQALLIAWVYFSCWKDPNASRSLQHDQ